jgi:hypothetical protein
LKKLAVFVEGQTEQMFVSKLIAEIAGEKKVIIEEQKATHAKSGLRQFTQIRGTAVLKNQEYYVLIRDCGSETTVQSDIRDSCEGLARASYILILGLRDVYPKLALEIPLLERGMKYGIPTKFMPIKIILAVMEIEAWFLAEDTHFVRVHPALTHDVVVAGLAFDPCQVDVETRYHPSEDLDRAYAIAGLRYSKKRSIVQRTIDALDYAEMYFTLPGRVKNLKSFIDELDRFFT